MTSPQQILEKVLKRYPDCPSLPDLPKSAAIWKEADFETFVESMGLIVPKGTTDGDGSSETQSNKEGAQDLNIKNLGTADACLEMPSSVYMVDRAPEGLKLESILTKFDQNRAAALQGLTGMSTQSLVDQYGIGILLSDMYYSMVSKDMPAVTAEVSVESEIDLPKMPLVPSRQRLMDTEGNTVCTAFLGQLMVDLSTGFLSSNTSAYNSVKSLCDQGFGRGLPTSSALAAKQKLQDNFGLAQQHPKKGKMFTPQKYRVSNYFVAPSDCDTYNTLYHPKVATMCEHASLQAGETFCCAQTTVFFCRFISTLPPGRKLVSHVFFDETENDGTRVLYVFEKDGATALVAFIVYGGPLPGTLYHEEVQAVSQKNADALIKWAGKEMSKNPITCDLSKVEEGQRLVNEAGIIRP